MKKQLTVEIRLTNKCELKCKHCLSPHNNKEMSKKILNVVFARIMEFMYTKELSDYFIEISLTGGEPFQYGHLMHVFYLIKPLDILFCMITNGIKLFDNFDYYMDNLKDLNGVLYISGDRFHLRETNNTIEHLKSRIDSIKFKSRNFKLDIELLTPNENWIQVEDENVSHVTHKEMIKHPYINSTNYFKFIGIDIDGSVYDTMGFSYGKIGSIKDTSIRKLLYI